MIFFLSLVLPPCFGVLSNMEPSREAELTRVWAYFQRWLQTELMNVWLGKKGFDCCVACCSILNQLQAVMCRMKIKPFYSRLKTIEKYLKRLIICSCWRLMIRNCQRRRWLCPLMYRPRAQTTGKFDFETSVCKLFVSVKSFLYSSVELCSSNLKWKELIFSELGWPSWQKTQTENLKLRILF